MAQRKTRKAQKKKVTTIPELKRSFDRLDVETQKLVASPGATSQKVAKFQKLWMSIFHKSVSKEAAEAYLAIKRRGKKHNKTRKQRGGMAPVDYQLRPGIDGPVGTFPAYQSAGLAFYDQINQRGQAEECGVKNFTPAVPVSIGSNQAGGTLGDFLTSATLRPITPSIPASHLENLQTYLQGRPLPPSSDPVTGNPPYIHSMS
jgi:hypothetical protein